MKIKKNNFNRLSRSYSAQKIALHKIQELSGSAAAAKQLAQMQLLQLFHQKYKALLLYKGLQSAAEVLDKT